MSGKRIWLIDGHNVIFAIPGLENLQLAGRREEARGDLVEILRRFAVPRGQKVLVAFDGDELTRQPASAADPSLEVTYTPRSAGGADGRILREVKSLLDQGHPVTVVTNDVSTLARELPDGAEHMEVRVFWRKYILGRQDKPVEGDFSDVESELLTLGVADRRERPPASPAGGREPRAPAPAAADPRAADAKARRERVLSKKARGRARQERLLKRRTRSRQRG